MQAPGPGLTRSQVQESRRRHGPAMRRPAGGRTYWQIAHATLFTPFNNILFVLGVASLALGRTNDAVVSAGLGLLNAVISSVQEMRAKHQLDALKRRYRSPVRVLRDGEEQRVPPEELVDGDLVHLGPGDQVAADGPVRAGRLEVDESVLTGQPGTATSWTATRCWTAATW